MPKGKVDYSKGLIYKLCCKDTNVKQIYIGSTTSFRGRKRKHKYSCTNSNSDRYNCKKYIFIREHGGWENWEMILVEYYSATDYLDLRKRERYWYDELYSNLNSYKPYRSIEEKKEYDNQKGKDHYYNNKEKRKDYMKEYRINNKVKIYDYRVNNKEKIKINNKNYYENNKEKWEEKMICECGSNISKYYYKQHCKTKKHIKFLNN